jgi:hypothetical protein
MTVKVLGVYEAIATSIRMVLWDFSGPIHPIISMAFQKQPWSEVSLMQMLHIFLKPPNSPKIRTSLCLRHFPDHNMLSM